MNQCLLHDKCYKWYLCFYQSDLLDVTISLVKVITTGFINRSPLT